MNEATNEQNLISIEEAASELGTTPLNILMHLKRRVLEGQEIDSRWYVAEPSLAAYLEAHKGANRDLCRTGCSSSGGCGSCG